MKCALVFVMSFLLGCNLAEAYWNYTHKKTELPALMVAIILVIICLFIGFGYLFN